MLGNENGLVRSVSVFPFGALFEGFSSLTSTPSVTSAFTILACVTKYSTYIPQLVIVVHKYRKA